jgi:hypothetical protein
MILKQKNQDVHSLPEFSAFAQFVSLSAALYRFCRVKSQGFKLFPIFRTLFWLAFQQRNFWRLLQNADSAPEFGRDTAYRFLNSPYHNWRRFLHHIACRAIIFLSTLTAKDKRKIFVVDDSTYDKSRSKKIELLSRVYDHVENRYLRGFRFLTLAFTDGISLIPLDFSLLGSKKTLCPANSDIDKRSHGSKRRLEAVCEAPEVLLSMVDDARNIISRGSYIVFDSWFCVPTLIRKLRERDLHVTGRLKNDNTRFLFRRNSKDALLTLSQLFEKLPKIPKTVRKRQQQTPDILGSLRVALPPVTAKDEKTGEKTMLPAVPVKIVFVKNRNASAQNKWLAILTTDLDLTEEEVVLMYAKRWKIEEFFKVAKSLLQLEREFQGRSYDMLVAHATLVCTRYIFLELERRRNQDLRTCGELFYKFGDELPDLKTREAIELIFQLLESFLKNVFPDVEKCLKEFISCLPAPLLRLFTINGSNIINCKPLS